MKWLGAWIAIALVLSGCDCGSGGRKGDSVAKWLDLEIERPEVEVSVIFEREYGEPDENGMITNTYPVHQGVVTVPMIPELGESSEEPPPDPFAAPATSETEFAMRIPGKIDPKKALEFYGVEFGPGSDATFDREHFALQVTQTPDQMDLVEAVIEGGAPGLKGDRSGIIFRVEIFELPAGDVLELERSAGEHFEHSAEHEAVLNLVRNRAARIVTTANLRARSGVRTQYEDSREIRFVSGFTWEGEGENRTLIPEMSAMKVGTIVEVDPVLGPDDLTLDVIVGLEHQLAPVVREAGELSVPGVNSPVGVQIPRALFGSIQVTEVMHSGQTKLLCSWEVPADTGSEPLRRLVFIKGTAAKHLP